MTTTIPGAAFNAEPNPQARAVNETNADSLKSIRTEFCKKLDFLIWYAKFSSGKADRLSGSLPVEQLREEMRRNGHIVLALVESLATPAKALLKLLDVVSVERD